MHVERHKLTHPTRSTSCRRFLSRNSSNCRSRRAFSATSLEGSIFDTSRYRRRSGYDIRNPSFTRSSVLAADERRFPHEVPTPNNQDQLARSHQELRGRMQRTGLGPVSDLITHRRNSVFGHNALLGFLKTRQPTKHSGVVSI